MNETRKSIYIETTIPSYAAAKPSSNELVAGRQALTKVFWQYERYTYDLVISQDVWDECGRGDSEAAQKRLKFLEGIDRLSPQEGLDELADIYQNILNIPDNAKTDCYHLAYCVLNRIDYLLSWNCRHLGLDSYQKVREYNDKHRLWIPMLVTPANFLDV